MSLRIPARWFPWTIGFVFVAVLGLSALGGGCPQIPSVNGNDNGGQTDNGNQNDNGDDNGNDNDDDNDNGGTNSNDNANDNGGGNDNGNGNDNDNDNGGGNDNGNNNDNVNDNGGDNDNDNTNDNGGGNDNGNGNDNDNDNGGGGPPLPPTSISLSALVRTGDPVPGQPAGVTFTAFGEPIIDGWNRVAFWALYGGTGARGRSGLYVWNGTEIVRILDDDPDGTIAVPGRGAEFRWGSSIANYDPRALDISWGGGSRLLFVSEVARRTGSSSTRIRGVYRWRATDNSLARVADRDQLATNYADVDFANNGDPLFEAEFFRPGITDDGFAIFSTTYQYITTTSLFPTGSGVFTSNGTTLTPLSDDQIRPQPVPDQAATKFFRNPERPTTVSGGGDMIFQSKWGSPTSGPGVFMRRGSTSFRVIDNRTAATWPGLPNITQVNPTNAAYAGVAIGPLGHIAVATTVATSGGNRAAVLLWNPYAVTWMELTGSLGTPADALFTGVNDDGDAIVQVGAHLYRAGPAGQQRLTDVLPIGLQVANVTWNATGGALNNLGRAALPYTHPGGQAGLAYWTGEQFLIVADEVQNAPAGLLDIRTKSDPWRDRPGRSGILNDFDILVFRALFNDNSETLYLVRGE